MRTLFGVALLVNLILSAAVYVGRREAARLGASIDSVSQIVGIARAERRALIATLAEVPFSGPLLRGVEASSGATLSVPVDSVHSQIVYLVSSACRACEINFSFLDSLSRERPSTRVVAFSRSDDADELSKYVRRHQLSFPVLSRPSGYAELLLPRFSVPLTAVLQRGRLVALIRGTLKDDDKSGIRAIFVEE